MEVIAAVANITANASALESSAITVSGYIIEDLTDAAVEDPEVSITSCTYQGMHNFSYPTRVKTFLLSGAGQLSKDYRQYLGSKPR